uniref:Uncharacterized protein n=1 Tax=Caenorhabditis japonica TaxID=281687 RepID=A0A8R1DXR7_CAEJA
MNFSSFFCLLASTSLCFLLIDAKPTTTTTTEKPDDSFDLDLFLGASGDGHFADANPIGMTMKKSEKLPGQKKIKSEFQEPEGVVPEFTGSFITEKPVASDEETDEDYFGTGGSADTGAVGPVTNPAATYLEGADFEKIEQPKCQMLGCTGPIPNDGSYAAMSATLEEKACTQIFVAMNGCTDNKGYPMGMLCSVCCDCANSFVAEMKKTFGWKSQIPTKTFQ